MSHELRRDRGRRQLRWWHLVVWVLVIVAIAYGADFILTEVNQDPVGRVTTSTVP